MAQSAGQERNMIMRTFWLSEVELTQKMNEGDSFTKELLKTIIDDAKKHGEVRIDPHTGETLIKIQTVDEPSTESTTTHQSTVVGFAPAHEPN